MATYVISDIHGMYDKFTELLEIINFQETDTLYILGDIIDRGPKPIEALIKIKEMKNVKCLLGNHEYMALQVFDGLKANNWQMNDECRSNYLNWTVFNAGKVTFNQFLSLDKSTQNELINFVKSFSLYEKVKVNDKDFLLVHGGLGNFSVDKPLEDYTMEELVWYRTDYNTPYFEDRYVVSGHTPTQLIEENPNPGYILQVNNHIAIDCGAFIPNGRLAAICLDTLETYYTSSTN